MALMVGEAFRPHMRQVCVIVLTLVAVLLFFANHQLVRAQIDCPDGGLLNEDPFVVWQLLDCSGGAGVNAIWEQLGIDEKVPWSPQTALEIVPLFVEITDRRLSDPPLITLYGDVAFAKTAMNLAECASVYCIQARVLGESQYAVLTIGAKAEAGEFLRTWAHLIFRYTPGGWHFTGHLTTLARDRSALRIVAGGDTVWLAVTNDGSVPGSHWSFERWFDLSLETITKEQIGFYHWTTATAFLDNIPLYVSSQARPRFFPSTMGAPQLTLLYEILFETEQADDSLAEIARVQRQVLYAFDETTGNYRFTPDQSTVTEAMLDEKFATFRDGADFLRFVADELRTSYAVSAPEQQATQRTFVEALAESPEKQALLAAMGSAPAEIICPNGLPTRLAIGIQASVTPGEPNGLWSDWQNSPNRKKVDTMPAGTAMLILAGPHCRNGYTWWQVRSLVTNLTGWTAESRGGAGYFLAPQ